MIRLLSKGLVEIICLNFNALFGEDVVWFDEFTLEFDKELSIIPYLNVVGAVEDTTESLWFRVDKISNRFN